ncbi:MAG: thioredoxin family protein [Ilumatobacteraceae bacterium]
MREVDGARFRAQGLPEGRVPIMFTTDWCGYCRRFLPLFGRLPGAWVVDISDDDDPLWDDHAIRVVPTVILFEDGKPIARWEGVLGAAHVEAIRAKLL